MVRKILSLGCYFIMNFSQRLLNNINHYACLYQCSVGQNSKFYATSNILNAQKNKNKIIIGQNSHIRGELFVYGHGGTIEIGNNCYIGENSKIWSSGNIKIGNSVLIAHNVNIHDSNSHPTDIIERQNHFIEIISKGHPKNLFLDEQPIFVGSNVWIGFNATILKGVTIGEGAIIGSCSVVTKDVSPYTVVAGNPAKVIKILNQTI